MFEPTLATLAAGTNVAIKLAEYGLQLSEASSEVRVFSRLIKRVQADLDEALRLHGSAAVRTHFGRDRAALRAQEEWVGRVVRDAVEALAEIGRYVEGARIDEARERSMRLDHRFQWIFDHRNKVVMQEKALATCHASLLSAIEKLHRIEEGVVVVAGAGRREGSEAGAKGSPGEEVGGGRVGEQAPQLPTYESSQYDERVVPWVYKPEGDVALKPPSVRRRFMKSKNEKMPAVVVEQDSCAVPKQQTTPTNLNHDDFSYLHMFIETPPVELPAELPAEVPPSLILSNPLPQAAEPSPSFLSAQSAHTERCASSWCIESRLAAPSIPQEPKQTLPPNGPRLSASSKRRSFRKAKFNEITQSSWENPDSINSGVGWAS